MPRLGELTGTMTVEADGSKTTDPPNFGLPPGTFAVSSGPCAVSDRGRCVGRAGGYGLSEVCAITVGGGGGALGACGVFDVTPAGYVDSLTMQLQVCKQTRVGSGAGLLCVQWCLAIEWCVVYVAV